MTYDAREISDYGGAPVELFKFYRGTETWLFTSSAKDETYGGETYISVPISRSGIDKTGEARKTPLTITLDATEALPQLFRIFVPASTLWLKIYMGHRDETTGEVDPAATVAFWTGRIRGVNFAGAKAEVKCDPMDALLDRQCLRVGYQKKCNYSPYDADCRVDPAPFTVSCRVTGIDGTTLTISGVDFSNKPENWFTAGEIITADGDRREIKSHTTTTAVISLPFENLHPGATVSARAGCDGSLETCKEKFDNTLNHGGFPTIPGVNIFKTGLKPAVP